MSEQEKSMVVIHKEYVECFEPFAVIGLLQDNCFFCSGIDSGGPYLKMTLPLDLIADSAGAGPFEMSIPHHYVAYILHGDSHKVLGFTQKRRETNNAEHKDS